jgi:hypothetical protein
MDGRHRENIQAFWRAGLKSAAEEIETVLRKSGRDAARATPGTNFCPSLSPDGKYLFFCACRDIYWVSSEVIERLRPHQ